MATTSTQTATEGQIIERLIEHIKFEGLSAGERLPPIRKLAELWGLRPHEVRDGVLQAHHLGLVDVRPQAGIYVQSPDMSSVLKSLENALSITALTTGREQRLMDLLEARRLVEVELIATAASRRRIDDLLPLRRSIEEMETSFHDRAAFVAADTEFHLEIARIAGHSIWPVVLQSFLVLLRPFREAIRFDPSHLEETQRQHREIYKAIQDGNVKAAKAAMAAHITYSPEFVLELSMSLSGSLGEKDDKSSSKKTNNKAGKSK